MDVWHYAPINIALVFLFFLLLVFKYCSLLDHVISHYRIAKTPGLSGLRLATQRAAVSDISASGRPHVLRPSGTRYVTQYQ